MAFFVFCFHEIHLNGHFARYIVTIFLCFTKLSDILIYLVLVYLILSNYSMYFIVFFVCLFVYMFRSILIYYLLKKKDNSARVCFNKLWNIFFSLILRQIEIEHICVIIQTDLNLSFCLVFLNWYFLNTCINWIWMCVCVCDKGEFII